jgi:hypothetical protein
VKKHILSVLAYVVASFVVQALSHFVLFAGHYATIGFARHDPIFVLGIGSMLIQGAMISLIFARTDWAGTTLGKAVLFSLMCGAILVSYEGMAEAAKYAVPGIAAWIGVETLSGAVQFVLAGLGLGLAHGARIGKA